MFRFDLRNCLPDERERVDPERERVDMEAESLMLAYAALARALERPSDAQDFQGDVAVNATRLKLANVRNIPMDVILAGSAMRFRHASHAASTMAS
jgi:hypothetical protein